MIPDSWKQKHILILGFGREGRSTLSFLRHYFPRKPLFIADQDTSLPDRHQHLKDVTWITGEQYLDGVDNYDVIIKSPGIQLKEAKDSLITSQTDIFLQLHRKQTIGVTGTKGKSTTASLIHHIVKQQQSNTMLIGNIGTAPLDKHKDIDGLTIIVQEMSAHQLEHIHVAPHIAVFLNLFEEHLDHFASKEHYYNAKRNILMRQNRDDYAVLNAEGSLNGDLDAYGNYPSIAERFAFKQGEGITAYISNRQLVFIDGETRTVFPAAALRIAGTHNQLNALAAIIAAKRAGITDEHILKGLQTFEGLPHRLEYVGKVNDILFYNDAISTVPETTIQALRTLKNTHTLILGGYDRKINYQQLYEYLTSSSVKLLIFTGPAGKRMKKEYEGPQASAIIEDAEEIVSYCVKHTPSGKICLLSPAAASYDRYKNFEERGDKFRNAVEKIR